MFEALSAGCGGLTGRAIGIVRRVSLGAWLGVLGVLALLIILRWNTFDAPLVRDEGEYAYAAQLLRHGLHPYEHAFLQKPPMIIYTYAAAGAIAPHTVWFPRVLAAVFAAVAAGLLGWIARLEFGRGVALPAMWLVTPMLLAPGLEQFTANTEMFLVVPLLAAFACYAVSRHGSGGAGAWFLAGAFGAVAFWYKYIALPVLALLFAVWSIQEVWCPRFSVSAGAQGTGDSLKAGHQTLLARWLAAILGTSPHVSRFTFHAQHLARRWLLLGLGAGLASLAVLAPFLAWDGGRHLWECTVVFNRFYRASATFGWSGLLACVQWFWLNWWVLFLLLPVLLLRPRPRPWFWIGIFLTAMGLNKCKRVWPILPPRDAVLGLAGGVSNQRTRCAGRTAPGLALRHGWSGRSPWWS